MTQIGDGTKLEPAAARLQKLLKERRGSTSQAAFAARIGRSAEWISKFFRTVKNGSPTPVPIEILHQAILELKLPLDAFCGTREWATYQGMGEAERRFVEAVGRRNHEKAEVITRLTPTRVPATDRRVGIASFFFLHGVEWPAWCWVAVMDGQLSLTMEPALLRKVENALGLGSGSLGIAPEPGVLEIGSEAFDRAAVDRLVLEKLRAPGPGRAPALRSKELMDETRTYLEGEIPGEVWAALDAPTRDAIIQAVAPLARKFLVISASCKRLAAAPEDGSHRAVIREVAAHLPRVEAQLRPAAKRLKRGDAKAKADGTFVSRHAHALDVPEAELALLLLGLAATRHFPQTAKKLRQRHTPKRKNKWGFQIKGLSQSET